MIGFAPASCTGVGGSRLGCAQALEVNRTLGSVTGIEGVPAEVEVSVVVAGEHLASVVKHLGEPHGDSGPLFARQGEVGNARHVLSDVDDHSLARFEGDSSVKNLFVRAHQNHIRAVVVEGIL